MAPAQKALGASTVALIVAVACTALFMPPLVAETTRSPIVSAFVGCTLAAALLLHWAFVAIGARRLGRSAVGWTVLAVVLFPVGSVVALLLLSWYGDEDERKAAAA